MSTDPGGATTAALDSEQRSDLDTISAATVVAHTGPQPPEGPPRTGRLDYKWVALAVVLGGSIMTILDATVVNVAIPTLQTAFNAKSYNDITWVVTGYMLAQGAVIPVTGWVTDRYGTKRVYLITLFLFTAASALCGLAWNLPTLIVFRVLQGVGGGMTMPIGMTIILRAVGPSEMGRVMGIFGVPMLLAPAIGPVLGGWLVQDFTWRLIFYINIPVGIVTLIAASRLLRETPFSHTMKLDWIGFVTGTMAVLSLMYGVDRSSTLGWRSATVITLLALAAVLFVAFVWRQRVAAEPLLHLELFRDGTFSASILLSFFLVTALFGGMVLLPLYLQQVHGYDAITTGLILMPAAITAAIVMPVGGYLSDRIGPRPVVLVGVVSLIIGGIMLAQIHANSSVGLLVGAMAVRGLAMGFAMMPSMSAALARIPRHLTSRASSITNTVQRAGSSVGIAVLVTILAAQVGTAASQAGCDPSPDVLASVPAHAVVASDHPLTPVSAAALCSAMEQKAAASSQNQQGQAKPPRTGNAAFDAFTKSYGDDTLSIAFDRTFAFTAILTALGIIPALFLRRPEKQGAGDVGTEAAVFSD